MKFIPEINIFGGSQKKKLTCGIILLLVLSLLVFALKFFSGRDARMEEALLSSHKVELSVSDAKNPDQPVVVPADSANNANDAAKEASAVAPAPVTDNAATSSEASSTALTDSAPVAKPESEKEEAKEAPLPSDLAWMKEDFMGPRISDEMTESLKGHEDKHVELKKSSVSELGDKPVIVVIIKGLGLSSSSTEEAFDLPPAVTMGFSPYSSSLADWVKKAKDKGHEVVINIPMETKDFNLNDPGPYALATSVSNEDNITRLKMLLSLVKGYEAVYSETEEIFTQSISNVTPILETLKNEGKYFIYGGGYAEFSLIQVAESLKYPILVNDILLDDEISESSINEKFRKIEEQAHQRGYVVVMAHPYPITIRMLEIWLPQVQSRGIKIAPVSVLLGKSFVD